MKRAVIGIALVSLCFGLATCEKSCDTKKAVETKKPADTRKTPPAPRSKWVGKWVNLKGSTSYVIESESSGSLHGYIPRGAGKEKVTMRLQGDATAVWTSPLGVEVRFTLKSGNQITMQSLGVSAQVLKIVR